METPSNKHLEELLHQHLVSDNARLDRIESKIDQLAETVVALARAEEKLINLERSRSEISDILDAQEERLDIVESRSKETEMTLGLITRLFWILVASGATVTAGYFMQT